MHREREINLEKEKGMLLRTFLTMEDVSERGGREDGDQGFIFLVDLVHN